MEFRRFPDGLGRTHSPSNSSASTQNPRPLSRRRLLGLSPSFANRAARSKEVGGATRGSAATATSAASAAVAGGSSIHSWALTQDKKMLQVLSSPPSRRVDSGDDEILEAPKFRAPPRTSPLCFSKVPSMRNLDRVESFTSYCTELDFLASSNSVGSWNSSSTGKSRPSPASTLLQHQQQQQPRSKTPTTSPPHLFRLTTQSSARYLDSTVGTRRRQQQQHQPHHRSRPDNPVAMQLRRQLSTGSLADMSTSTMTTAMTSSRDSPEYAAAGGTSSSHHPHHAMPTWHGAAASSFQPFRRASM